MFEAGSKLNSQKYSVSSDLVYSTLAVRYDIILGACIHYCDDKLYSLTVGLDYQVLSSQHSIACFDIRPILLS